MTLTAEPLQQFESTEKLTAIAAERVYDVAIKSSMYEVEDPLVSQSNHWYLKAEYEQPTRSFKCRGAYLEALQVAENSQTQDRLNFVAASAGNHGQGLAMAAQALRSLGYDTSATVYVPRDTPDVKTQAMRELGASVRFVNGCVDDALAAARQHTGGYFVHPFDSETVLQANGTVASEILDQLPQADRIVIPGGGGGLAAGMARVIKEHRPNVQVVVAQLKGADAISQSYYKGYDVTLDRVTTLSDGTAVKKAGQLAMHYIRKYVDEVVVVEPHELGQSLHELDMLENPAGSAVKLEPAGALAYAALRRMERDNPNLTDQHWVAVASGANADPVRVRQLQQAYYRHHRATNTLGRGSIAAMVKGFNRA